MSNIEKFDVYYFGEIGYFCDMEFKHQIGEKWGYEASISDLGQFWEIQAYGHDF